MMLNLPSSLGYTPSKTWVAYIRKDVNKLSDVFIYIDYICSIGWCDASFWHSV